jgi:hypothetical protein
MDIDKRVIFNALHKLSEFSWFFLFIFGTIISGCAGESMILELKDVQFFKSEQISSTPPTIRISGLAFHSSMAVQQITATRADDTSQILIHMVLTRPSLSGSFDYTYEVPSSVNAVTFGNEKTPIWNRSSGLIKQK